MARKLLRRVVRNAKAARLLSNEHFSVDGTLIESWAAVKSMRRRDGKDEPPGPGRNPMVDFHGERRTNETHVSPSDPEAILARKGKGQAAKLNYMGHVLMDHRHGLPVDVEVTAATGYAEREAALKMLDRPTRAGRRTLAADKGYDMADFVRAAASAASRRTSPVTTTARVARRSMRARPDMPATGSVRGSASASRKALAGARMDGRCAR